MYTEIIHCVSDFKYNRPKIRERNTLRAVVDSGGELTCCTIHLVIEVHLLDFTLITREVQERIKVYTQQFCTTRMEYLPCAIITQSDQSNIGQR